jgi:hypothetical protein
MDKIPIPAADQNAAALVVARSNEEILTRLSWLFRRMAVVEEEIAVLLDEVSRRRASLPPTPST